ncbi:unknown [Parabacteroides johnsonii CAG:246]|nr:unknown [Parabacteroides johnsonii CAG:246]
MSFSFTCFQITTRLNNCGFCSHLLKSDTEVQYCISFCGFFNTLLYIVHDSIIFHGAGKTGKN